MMDFMWEEKFTESRFSVQGQRQNTKRRGYDSLAEFVCLFSVEISLSCVQQTWQRPTLPCLETKYHWRRSVSRPSSEWDRVQPLRHSHQVGKRHKRLEKLSVVLIWQRSMALPNCGVCKDEHILAVSGTAAENLCHKADRGKIEVARGYNTKRARKL